MFGDPPRHERRQYKARGDGMAADEDTMRSEYDFFHGKRGITARRYAQGANMLVISHQFMPADPAGDALHLALASVHKCDFLLTWNCRHLANANKFAQIRSVKGRLGLFAPTLTTPSHTASVFTRAHNTGTPR